ncbi:MAG: hypothetical protein E7348_03300 [Clostridiales bacterium]|nr:hypothetical protein [Clostridiales bacterium]
MKKLCTLTAFLTFFINITTYFFNPTITFAQSTYLRVINNETPFYQNVNDTEPCFYLPYTYYVKVLDNFESLTHVEIHGKNGIAGIDGYVPTDDLFDDGLEVINPFLCLDITTAGTTVLYQDRYLVTPSQYIFAQRKLKYYGHISSENGNIYYVSYNNKLGYVKESDILPFAIQNHPNELTFIVQPSPPVEEEQYENTSNNSDFFGLKSVIIVCLLFAGLIALFIALGKKNDNRKSNYYEENDYE